MKLLGSKFRRSQVENHRTCLGLTESKGTGIRGLRRKRDGGHGVFLESDERHGLNQSLENCGELLQ
jgi:hypothetical protein